MPEQLLDHTAVRAPLEEMGGNRVPEGVRRDAIGHARPPRRGSDHGERLLAGQPAAAVPTNSGPPRTGAT
jgi:hypothetical protein